MTPSPEFSIIEAVTIMFLFGVVIAIEIVRSVGGTCRRCGTPQKRYSLAHAVPASFFSILYFVLRKHLILSHDALLLDAFPSRVVQSHSSTAVHCRTRTAP